MMPPTVEVEFAGTEEIDYGISNYEPLHEDTAIVVFRSSQLDWSFLLSIDA